MHRLMERIDEIDTEIGLPFAWFFLMTHGHWVDPNVGHAIAEDLRTVRCGNPIRTPPFCSPGRIKSYLFGASTMDCGSRTCIRRKTAVRRGT